MAKLSDEEKICGLHACRAVFTQRKKDLRKIYLESSRLADLKDVLRYCAQHSIGYKIVSGAELEKISKTMHHEGVVFRVRSPVALTLDEMNRRWQRRFAQKESRVSMLLLENIRDPHNAGAILRSAAHFGVDTVLTYGETSKRNPALLRTAEGGADKLDWFEVRDLSATLRDLRSMGFVCAATSSHATQSLYAEDLPPRTLFMVGAEREGLSESLANEAELTITIPGSGAVESLNVATATAVLLAEFQRQNIAASPRRNTSSKASTPQKSTSHTKPTKKSAPQKRPTQKPPSRTGNLPKPHGKTSGAKSGL